MDKLKITQNIWFKSGLYLLITVVYVFAVFRLGIPLSVKIAELVGKDKGTDIVEEENIILAPRLNYLPSATNSAELRVSGSAPANQMVDIYLNDAKEVETTANAEGYFEDTIILNLGSNQVHALTRDPNGNTSGISNLMKISFLDIAPELTITEPVDGAEIKQKDNYILIKGNTEAGLTLKVNNRLGVINEDGSFSYRLGLNQGENVIVVEVTDTAGNKQEKKVTINFKKR